MKTNSKISAYILRSAAAALLFSCVIVALSSAINLPNHHPKVPAPQNNTASGVNGHEGAACVTASAIRRDRTLTFADRVAYQRAIEEVYWRHRIWPKENPEPKPPLDKVLSQAEIEEKVEDYLRNAQALEDYWQRPITPDQLQAEMERFASHTKQPGVLREIFAALGDDPFVIAECLARPVLAERLITELYAHDQRFHGELKRRAEAELRTRPSVTHIKQTSGQYTETEWVKSGDKGGSASPSDAVASAQAAENDGKGNCQRRGAEHGITLNSREWNDSLEKLAKDFGNTKAGNALAQIKTGVLSPLQEDDGHYYAVAVMKKGKDRLKLATVAWLKEPLRSWLAKVEAQAPVTMAAVSANYTLPVISGQADNSIPSSCSWSAGPNMPSPNLRSVGVFFPANGKFYAMGGRGSDSPGSDFMHPFEYDSSNGWTTDLAATYPDNQVSNMACGVLNDGGADYIYCVGGSAAGGTTASGRLFRYDPMAHTLTTVGAPWPGAMGTVLPGGFSVFNNKLYILGGFNINTGMVDTIYEFTPSPFPGSWVQRPAHLPVALGFIPTATIGNRIYMAGGSTWNGTTLQDSSVSIFYDLTTDTIGPIATIPRATAETRGLNFQNTMYVLGGGRDAPNPSNDVDVYDPAVNIWSMQCPFVFARRNFPADTNGTDHIWLAGGYASDNITPLSSMEIFDCPVGPCVPTCTDDTWTATSTTNAPSGRAWHTAIWTGSEMIVWGGIAAGVVTNTGGKYNPITDSWTATSTTSAPTARWDHTAIWTGSKMIVWGGDSGGPLLNTGGRYNPIMDSWTATSTTSAPSARVFHTAVWTGSEMIVWGGDVGSAVVVNTGGRYDPIMDSWTATSTTNAPAARQDHTAVWTGSKMIVWGGDLASGTTGLATGGRYNPIADTWTATSITGAPSGRYGHSAVWTGSEMIVWGGYGNSYFNTGGRYNPNTDSWTATSTNNAPSVRAFPSAVWTGCEMIVWGGTINNTIFFNTGGRYNPGTDSWIATSTTSAPTGRYLHTAVWIGNEMIAWGGYDGTYSNTGGRYRACCPMPTPRPPPRPRPRPTPRPRP